MKPKTIEQICDELAKERGLTNPDSWHFPPGENKPLIDFMIEVCKRFGREVAKATLEKASNEAIADHKEKEWGCECIILKETITDENNIVLPGISDQNLKNTLV